MASLEYKQIVEERTKIINKLKELENNEIVKEYLTLQKQERALEIKQLKMYKEEKVKEYDSCNHIWVHVLHDYDSWEGRSYNYYGCIKCGLDQRVFELMDRLRDKDFLSLDQQIMYDYLYGRSFIVTGKGINTHLSCDFNLAKELYTKIKQEYQDIDDETTINIFEKKLKLVK